MNNNIIKNIHAAMEAVNPSQDELLFNGLQDQNAASDSNMKQLGAAFAIGGALGAAGMYVFKSKSGATASPCAEEPVDANKIFDELDKKVTTLKEDNEILTQLSEIVGLKEINSTNKEQLLKILNDKDSTSINIDEEKYKTINELITAINSKDVTDGNKSKELTALSKKIEEYLKCLNTLNLSDANQKLLEANTKISDHLKEILPKTEEKKIDDKQQGISKTSAASTGQQNSDVQLTEKTTENKKQKPNHITKMAQDYIKNIDEMNAIIKPYIESYNKIKKIVDDIVEEPSQSIATGDSEKKEAENQELTKLDGETTTLENNLTKVEGAITAAGEIKDNDKLEDANKKLTPLNTAITALQASKITAMKEECENKGLNEKIKKVNEAIKAIVAIQAITSTSTGTDAQVTEAQATTANTEIATVKENVDAVKKAIEELNKAVEEKRKKKPITTTKNN